MFKLLENKNFIIFFLIFFTLSSCAKEGFFKTGDARKNPPDPRERVKKNLEEGKGFRLSNAMGGKVIEEVQILNLQVQMNYGEHL